MLTVRLGPALRARLNELAEATGRSKSYYVRLAIEEFLDDEADYLLGIAALERNEPSIGIEELRHELGLRSAL